MNELPKIKFNGFLNGFRWSDSQKAFPDTYTQPNRRRNYHVVLYGGAWCVHPEEGKEILPFPSKSEAIKYAKGHAQDEKTEALIHDEQNKVETAWIYSFTAYPQKQLFPPDRYPVETHPGEKVL